MTQRTLIVLTAVAEAILLIAALILAVFVFPNEKGGINLMIFLPIVLLASFAASSLIVFTVMKNKISG